MNGSRIERSLENCRRELRAERERSKELERLLAISKTTISSLQKAMASSDRTEDA